MTGPTDSAEGKGDYTSFREILSPYAFAICVLEALAKQGRGASPWKYPKIKLASLMASAAKGQLEWNEREKTESRRREVVFHATQVAPRMLEGGMSILP